MRARVKGHPQPIRLTYHVPAHISVLEQARVNRPGFVGGPTL